MINPNFFFHFFWAVVLFRSCAYIGKGSYNTSMSDWDAESDDGAPSTSIPSATTAPIAAAAPVTASYGRRKFEDEDVEDKVVDDWEEEEEEQEKPDVSALQPLKKKSTVKQKIKEREEEEKRRAELGLDSEEEYEDDPVDRRKRERAAQIEADMANAANLFGTTKITQGEWSGRAALRRQLLNPNPIPLCRRRSRSVQECETGVKGRLGEAGNRRLHCCSQISLYQGWIWKALYSALQQAAL
jgi:hypothetical protein